MDREVARSLLQEVLSLEALDIVGEGEEGIVLGDAERTYKVFKDGPSHLPLPIRRFLIDTLGNPQDPPRRLLPVLALLDASGSLVIVSPRVRGERFNGGGWWELVAMLRECRARRIALTNIHPDNLIWGSGGLVFVDLGTSTVPLTGSLWEQMIRRAFLTFRYPDRPDLRELMARSLTEDLPELVGLDLFRHDVEGEAPASPPPTIARREGPSSEVSLLILTCSMEWATIDFQIAHLVGQLEGPYRFQEVIVATDDGRGPFARQHDRADPVAHRAALRRLVLNGIVDRIVTLPTDPEVTSAVAERWFGIRATSLISSGREPTIASLWALDQCRTNLVLQTDSDILIGRDPKFDLLGRLIEVLEQHGDAVSVSLPPLLKDTQAYSSSGPNGKWRMEVRCSLLHRQRLEGLLPLENREVGGRFELSWYRALDQRLRRTNLACYRGGDSRSFMVHVPNEAKQDRNQWFNILRSIENGARDATQFGAMDLQGGLASWLSSRREDIVFVVRGRNVPLLRLDRCLQSLLSQSDQSFGVLFIDAGSGNGMTQVLEAVCRGPLFRRATLYRNWEPSPPLENQVRVLRELVPRPDTIVALLDADDALLARTTVEKLRTVYREGADLTVGSMVRTDKSATYGVNFDTPRSHRGGNVWQHLRTFRRSLWGQVREEDLKMDGDWIPFATDWAFMLPMVEMASKPVWVRDPLYLYDPDPSRRTYTRADREKLIERICQKPAYPRPKVAGTS